jgi:signal transduction histidine kinase/ligand-binding sensor domain-containing protein/CheY-like chemotaxis protein
MKGETIKNIQFLFILIILSILAYSPVFGQFPRLNFKSFTEKEGLSKNYVRSICQDKDGFMWFGTPDGLDKFDGKNFINYNSLLKDSLAGNYQISYDILEDKEGIIWIATYSNGIILFDKNKEKVSRLKHNPNQPGSLSNDRVLDVFEDKGSNIWVATAGGGLNLWQKDSKRFIHFKNEPGNPNSIGSNYVSSISSDSKGNIWILSIDGIISKLNPKTGTIENIILPLASHSVTMRRGNTQAIYVDSEDNVIAGSYFGLFIIDAKTGSIKHFAQLNPKFQVTFIISSILEIKKGIIAVGTTFQGLYLVNIKTGESVNYSNSVYADYFLNSPSITSIYKSKNGLIWLGSWNAGINMYNKEFSQFQLLTDIVKSGKDLFQGTRGAAFCTTPDNKIWIASGDKEIIAYNPQDKTAQMVLKNNISSSVNCLYNNNKGEIFIGTSYNGLIIYNFWKKSVEVLKNNPNDKNTISSNFIFCTLQDRDSNIWMGFTGTGIDVWNRASKKITHFKSNPNNQNSINSDVIYKIIEDKTGRIWIGTQNGLCYYDKNKKSFIRYPLYLNKKNNILLNTILDIFEDSKGGIWVGTNRAILKLNPENSSCEIYSPQNEIPYLITNIMEDSFHNIWMTSFNKLFKLNPVSREFSVYNFNNGSSTPSFLGYSSLSFNEKFYLGSMDRIIVFDPSTIIEDTLKPRIFINQFEINNKLVSYGSSERLSEHIKLNKPINLDYDQSTFTFIFAALEYSFPEKIQYAYKLENFDKDWVYSGNLNNRAVYTKVPPGKYIFRIKATNKKGDWFESDQRLKVNIHPPFWLTLEFRIIGLFVILGSIYSIYRIRVKQLRIQKKKLEEIVKQRTISLKEAHESLAEQHEELKQQNEVQNQMSQQIIKQNKELEMHYSMLEHLVEERTLELKIAKDKAEESDNLKSAFLANMSHEIRTPMNAIVGFANLLRKENLTLEKRNKFIDLINSNSDSLLLLIDDILDLSMIEANQLVIGNEIVIVNEFLEKIHASYLQLNKNENIDLVFNNELHDLQLRVFADNERFRQILTNLISNAMKFTVKGIVEIGLKKLDNCLAFYVKDTGIGIPEKDIENIFERFRKNEDKKDVLYRGAGLGLAISRSLAQLLGGKLVVESVVGKGSIFTFLLPETYISSDMPIDKNVPVFKKDESLSDKNILVVEDEDDNFMYFRSVLTIHKLNVFRAENGLDALEMINSGMNFHVILMDIKMPVMNGFEATKIIKSKNPNQIVVAVTAFARSEEKQRFMEAGFDDYLAKPVKPSDLRRIIDKYLTL